MLKNKKGAELSMNIIVISIIVIVVLVVMVAFFLGSFKPPGGGGVTPDPLPYHIEICSADCRLAQAFTTDSAKAASSYCRKTINVDEDGDGSADIKAHCYSSHLGVEDCDGVRGLCIENPEESLSR
ncbi:hypothetical protein CL617_00815 [archaeon]|nr:hypothetical protein [archaeon]|tara:strand:- start:290 stop:667 length:378 start_codon:yes stop_codon:yes gene_type:complete